MLIGMDDHKKEYEKIRKQKSRKTLIGLDDLFNDHKKEHDKIQKIKSKPVKASRLCDSDDDEANETENKLSEALHDFKKTVWLIVLFFLFFLFIYIYIFFNHIMYLHETC